MALKLIHIGALAILLSLAHPAAASGPAMGLDADLAQLDYGLRDSDPAANGPGARSTWIPMVESNSEFTPAPSAGIRITHPGVRIGNTVRGVNRTFRTGPMRIIVTP
jgi:hypothetical protein